MGLVGGAGILQGLISHAKEFAFYSGKLLECF